MNQAASQTGRDTAQGTEAMDAWEDEIDMCAWKPEHCVDATCEEHRSARESTPINLTNHVVDVPGTEVTCYLGVWSHLPAAWAYSLWTGEGNSEELISAGELDLSGLTLTPSQVARVAYLLDVDYATQD